MFQMTFSYTPWKTKIKQQQHHQRHWLSGGLLFIAVILSLCCGQVIAVDVDDKDDSSIKVNVESTYNSLKFTLDENPEEYVLQNVTCKSVKNVEITGNDEHICENLDPCSTYLVVLDIKSLLSDPPFTFDRTMDAKTEYAEPTVEFDQVTPDIDHIDISWKATNATCIMEYKIEVKSTEKELHYQLSDKLELRVNELNPCQLYNITIKVIDVLSPIPVVNLTTSTRTEYAEPGDVTVTFTDDSRGSVRVQWETPMYKTCITAYHLKWFISDCTTELGIPSLFNETAIEESVCEWSVDLNDPNSVEYVLRNLQGCEDYGFEMYINQNETAKANEQFVSPEQVPGPVVEQNLEINSTYVNITWQPPKTHKKCVANYTVIVVGPLQTDPQTLETVTSLTSLKIEDLNPCGQYNLTIIAVSRNSSEALPKSSTFELSEAKPSVVRNITIQPFSSASEVSLSISWEIPEVAYLCVAKYRMSGWTDDNVNVEELDKRDIRETSIKIVGLTSCQAYVVQIIPVTRNDLDGQLTQTQTVTDAVVAKAPNNFLVVGLYPHRLELSAQESDKTNKCETISARFICTSVDDNATHKVAEQYVNDGQVGGISFKAVLSPLSPFVEYRCQVSLFNIAGWSQPKVLLQKTEQYFPDRPENLTIKASTNTSLTFSWTRPKFPNGVIKLYNTYFQMYERAYFVPPSCNIFVPEPMLRQTSNTEQNFGSLQPYTKYSMQIATQNDYGIGEYTRPFIVTTKPWVSDPVPYVTAKSEGPYLYDNEYRASVEVTWLAPCKSNGNIEQFYLHFLGERVNKTSEIFIKKIDPNLNADGYMSYNETDLKPEYNYTVIVSIKTQDVEELSVGMRATFDAPAGIPTTPGESILNQTRVNAFDSNNPTKTAVVRFPRDMLDSESGTVLYMALLVSEKNCNPEPQLRFDAIDALKEWPETLSWYDAYQDSNCIAQYQTTPIQWRPAASAAKAARAAGGVRFTPRDNEIVYVIGTDECNDKTTYYCNGPLKPDTEYNLVFRLFTKSGYRDSYMLEFRTDSVIQVTLILICVCSCLLFAFITGLIYLYITKRIQWNRESCNSVVDALGDIIPKNFATYYCDIAKPEKIAREFKELSGVAMDLSCAASELGTTKNRYTDIYPYDKNRVILDIDADGSDYINASFIDGYNRKKEYIATQGPKAESTMDFWRMILQYNVRVIVQVTQFREGDVIKCHQYFPFQSKGLIVTVKKKETFELYDRTEISASHDVYGLKQKVVHYYFKKWLDHECPADPNQLITFIKKVKTEKVPSYSPIVVHCSAGVGRTGTLIGLDIVMQRIKNESKINIFETVKKLRFQRMKMVQTQAQYAFLYKCTYELVKHKKAKQPANTKKNGKSVSFQDDNDLNENQTFPETLNGIKIDTINARTTFGPKPKLRIIKYDDDVIIEDADEKF